MPAVVVPTLRRERERWGSHSLTVSATQQGDSKLGCSRKVKIPTLVAKNATRMGHPQVLFRWNQFDGGMPPYFCSHFNSSRTLILPCQGFFARLWPSPGKISNAFGMPSE